MRFVFTLARFASAAALAAMAVIVMTEIVMRVTVGNTWQLSPEFAGYSLVAMTFLGMAGAYRGNHLMRIDVLYEGWSPSRQLFASIVFECVSLAAATIATWYSFFFVLTAYARSTKAPTLYATPLWIPESLMPIGLALLTVAIACRLVRTVRHGSGE